MQEKRPKTFYRIEVTEKDIERAKRNDSYTCVVVQAVARNIKDAHRIEVDTQAIRFTRDNQRFVYLTPYAVQGYVIAFDAGEPIKPFSFQLRDPARIKQVRKTAKGRALSRATNRAAARVKKTAKAKGLPVDDPTVRAELREATKTACLSRSC